MNNKAKREQPNLNPATASAFIISLLFIFTPAMTLATGSSNPTPAPNPELKASCGFDIALVLDSSGSISTSELNQMKSAFNGFVDSFLPGTDTLFSVTDFDTNGQVLQSFTNNLGLIHIAINTPVSGGNTNWADGLGKAFGTFDPRTGDEHPNLIVFASDGNPNRPTDSTEALKLAITKANEIKGSGTRIIALGIGDNLKVNNLKAISSSDAVYTSGFDTLADDLADLAQELCGGTITVKKILDSDNDLTTTDDQLPAAGWTFEIKNSQTVSKTTGADGFTPSLEVDQGVYSVTEVLQNNFKLLDAKCLVNGSPSGTREGLSVTDLSIDSNDIVSCTFINHENQAPVITIDGPNPHNILVSSEPYADPGFVATDLEDGDLTGDVVISGDTVDTSNTGTYVITYNVVDSDGLSATEKTRTVKVSAPPSECSDGMDNDGDNLIDFPDDPGCTNEEDDDENTPPVITADTLVIVTLGGSFDPLGHATVNDDEDDPEPNLVVGGDTVLTNTVGDYVVTYDATDSHGAKATQQTLTVQVRAVCSDTFDNDNDGVADSADPGCHTDADSNNPDSYDPNDSDETNPTDVCANLDGIQIMVPQGLVSQNGDCVSPSPICSDAIDNDEDGFVDADDPGCHSDGNADNPDSYDPNDNDETNVPGGSNLCEDNKASNWGEALPCKYDTTNGGGGGGGGNAPCSNSRDDDGDGLIDALDPGCHSDGDASNPNSYVPSDNTEDDGQVLGATTVPADPNVCFYLRDYMRRDLNNNPQEVLKLQAFLINFDMREGVSLTGVFDDATLEAVSLFQLKYAEDILEPWGHTDPTGYVYILTLKKINEIYCQRLFPLNEAQIYEIAAFKALLDNLRAQGIEPIPSYIQTENDADSSGSTTTPIIPVVGVQSSDTTNGSLGVVRGLATAIVANPESMGDIAKSIYGLLVFVIALYVLGNVLKDVFYKNTPGNLRKRFITKWVVVDLGLVLGIVASLVFKWWFVLPLFILLALSLTWTSLYPEHNSIRASVKSWYLVVLARAKSIGKNITKPTEITKEPVKEILTAKKDADTKPPIDKVIVMGPKK